MAAAWEQAGELRATVTALNHGRLAAEVGRRLTRRAATLADADLLQLTAPLHALLRRRRDERPRAARRRARSRPGSSPPRTCA